MGVAIVVAPAAARAAVDRAAAVPAAVLVPVEIDGTARARAAKGKAREVTGGPESLRRASRVRVRERERERERERGKEVTAAAAAAAAATATATAMLTTSTIIMVSHQTTLNRADDESALRLGIPKSASLVIWH